MIALTLPGKVLADWNRTARINVHDNTQEGENKEYIIKMLDAIESESALKRIFGFVHKFFIQKL